jgi:hypothetical protein
LIKELSKSPSPEARWRIKELLAHVKNERLFPSVERIRVVRAVEVLERIDDEQARRILTTLARGAQEAQLSLEARAALKRLKGVGSSGHEEGEIPSISSEGRRGSASGVARQASWIQGYRYGPAGVVMASAHGVANCA